MACRFETTFSILYLVDLSCKVELDLYLMPWTRNNFENETFTFSNSILQSYRTFRDIRVREYILE